MRLSEPWVHLGVWSPNVGLQGGVGLPWTLQSFSLCLSAQLACAPCSLTPHLCVGFQCLPKVLNQVLLTLQDTCLQPRTLVLRMWHRSRCDPLSILSRNSTCLWQISPGPLISSHNLVLGEVVSCLPDAEVGFLPSVGTGPLWFVFCFSF